MGNKDNGSVNPVLSPPLSCDIVMKGGITSGIVYPGAIYEISRQYRFVNIGGTSAGAIAAGLTAAAEYRRRNGSEEGFETLKKLPEMLTEKRGKATRLLSLFKPEGKSSQIFKLFMDLAVKRSMSSKIFRVSYELIKQNFILLIVLFVLFITFAIGSFLTGNIWISIINLVFVFIAFVSVFAISGGYFTIKRFKNIIEDNNFGVTTGFSDKKETNDETLTGWLYKLIQEVSGKKDGPLTFGDLKGTDPNTPINLKMVTTNLSYGVPYAIPFDEPGANFLFDPDEFRKLFPEEVVEHMIKNSGNDEADSPNPQTRSVKAKNGIVNKSLYKIPSVENFPVIAAVRMSLSFPVLIGAVPLFTNKRIKLKDTEEDFDNNRVKRCWFSDGGICSNFPVHFFDSPIPSRPTFAINLRTFPDYSPKSEDESKNIYIPESNRGGLGYEWNDISFSLKNFILSITKTMQNWNDNSQIRIPGFRDRICTVFLDKEEGGLNLDMNEEIVNKISERGRQSGIKLRDRFSPENNSEMNWNNHRWIRFRTSVLLITDYLRSFMKNYNRDYTSFASYKDILLKKSTDKHPSYILDDKETEVIYKELDHLSSQTNEWNEKGYDFGADSNCPKPKPELKIKPKL